MLNNWQAVTLKQCTSMIGIAYLNSSPMTPAFFKSFSPFLSKIERKARNISSGSPYELQAICRTYPASTIPRLKVS